MNNNIKEINKFLQFFKEIINSNNIVITEDMIYDQLIKFNIPENNKNINIKSIFEELELKLKNINTIKIDNTDNYINFSSTQEIKNPNPLKIYLSVDYNCIYKTANKLVKFLKEVPFQLRVSNTIRNDVIIIRVSTTEDLKELLEYIKSDITEGLLQPNPFCYTVDKCAITIDGNLSYNQIISKLLANYLNNKEDIESINAYDFYNYVIDVYNDTFITLKSYANNEYILDDKQVVFYKNILEFILKSSEDNFNMEMLSQHFNECNSLNKLNKEKKKYNSYNMLVIYKSINREKIPESLDRLYKYIESNDKNYISREGFIRMNMYLNNFKQNIKNILSESNTTLTDLYEKFGIYDFNKNVDISKTSKELKYVMKELSEYHNYSTIIDILQIFLATNDLSLITRENDLRTYVNNTNLRKNILSTLIQKKLSFTTYCETLDNYILPDYIEEMKQEPIIELPIEEEQTIENTSEEEKVEDDTSAFDDLDEHLDITSIMVAAVNSANEIKEEERKVEDTFIEPEVNYDTLDDETSAFLEQDLKVDDIISKINLITDEIDNQQYSEKEEILKSALEDTYNKYQELYDDGKIKFDGYTLVNYAITSILENNNYNSFTRINEARKNIQELSPQEILDIMSRSLNLPQPELNAINNEALESIIRDYIDKVITDMKKNKEK